MRVAPAITLSPEQRTVPKSEASISNPDWTRDELILALNVYLKHRPNPPGKGSPEIVGLSRTLNRLGERLFPPEYRAALQREFVGCMIALSYGNPYHKRRP